VFIEIAGAAEGVGDGMSKAVKVRRPIDLDADLLEKAPKKPRRLSEVAARRSSSNSACHYAMMIAPLVLASLNFEVPSDLRYSVNGINSL
jgi:hypothetical protein